MSSEIGARIREERERQALTQAQLAEKAMTTGYTISRVETGAVQARPSTLRRIAGALEVDIQQLTDPEYQREPNPKGLPPHSEPPAELAIGDDRYLAAAVGQARRLRKRWQQFPPTKADLFHLENLVQSFTHDGELLIPRSGGTLNDHIRLEVLASDLEKLGAIADRIGESEDEAERRRQTLRLIQDVAVA